MEFDVSAYLGVFLDEVDEQLEILNNEILNLEKDPTNVTTIQNIFRAAHTLKGSSASMGFEKMKEFTHHLENTFEKIRQQHLHVTSEVITLIFESIDLLKEMKEAILNNCLEGVEIASYIHRLNRIEQSEQVEQVHVQEMKLDEYQQFVIQEGILKGYAPYEICISLKEETLMKSVRALVILKEFEQLGDVIAIQPTVEEIEGEAFEGEMIFQLLTLSSEEEVHKRLVGALDIEKFSMCVLKQQEKMVEEAQLVAPAVEENPSKVNATVRVGVDKLEYLMNLVGELVIDQTRLVDVKGRFADKQANLEAELDVFGDITNHLNRVITDLQEGMMKTRMLPIEQLFNRFPRMVRDTAMTANKQIQFEMLGKETELDRSLIEEISDPIIHLLRNAIDHGVETPEERVKAGKPREGKVTLKAAHEENHIVITVTDDGRGIDTTKVKAKAVEKGLITAEEADRMGEEDARFLIFKSGMSTAAKLTDISGRGVGMDIVRSHIEKLNGIITIDSEVGHGTSFTLKLPLTLAIIRSLLVKFGDKTFAIPLINVLEIIRLNREDIQIVNNQEVGVVRGRILPLVRMKKHLHMEEDAVKKSREFVVVIGIADKRIGIIVDKTIGNQEVVIKSLGSYIGTPKFISGATIMGDGNVALILDISSIVKAYGAKMIDDTEQQKKNESSEGRFVTFKLGQEEYAIEIQSAKDIIPVLPITKVVDSVPNMLGVIHLRGKMLPVFNLRNRLNADEQPLTKKSRIVVVEQGKQMIGLLVDEVTEVLKVNIQQIDQPNLEQTTSNIIEGVYKSQERVVLILALPQLLASYSY